MPNLLATDSISYDPDEQASIILALKQSGDQSLTQLQKQTGTSRPRTFEAITDLSHTSLVTIARSNATVTIRPHASSLLAAKPPIVPSQRIVLANLPGKYPGEQRGKRPAVVISDYDTTALQSVNVIPLTSNCDRPAEGTTKINATDQNSLNKDSLALCHNIKTVSKT